jgi:chorismate mutase/prephenate dehydrogenase
MQLAAEIGLVKEKDGLEVRDRQREKQVRAKFANEARSVGLDPVFSEILAELFISRAVRTQLTSRPKDLLGKKALVVGGSGRMGAWFCRRLSNRGAEVQVWDPRGRLAGYRNVKSLGPAAKSADLIIVSSPPGTCPDDLKAVLDTSPIGLVFDVCSVKSHIAGQLKAAARAGVKITSVHPMFGPNAANPKGRNVIICDCGNRQANQEAERLFKAAGANVVSASLESHDRLMVQVLGLPHACTLLFAGVLAESGPGLKDLMRFGGPSFDRMITAARELSKESVRVYHDIQALNPGSKKMYANMAKALGRVEQSALQKDPAKFKKIVQSIREYVEVT